MKIVYHYIFLLAINYLIFIHVLLIFNDAMILFHGLFWRLTHEKNTPEGAASRPGFRGFGPPLRAGSKGSEGKVDEPCVPEGYGRQWTRPSGVRVQRVQRVQRVVVAAGAAIYSQRYGLRHSHKRRADSRQPTTDSGHQPTGFPPPERQRTQPLLYNLRQSRAPYPSREYCQIS